LIILASTYGYVVMAAWISGYIMKKLESPYYWDHPLTFFGGILWPVSLIYILLSKLTANPAKKAFEFGQKVATSKQVRVPSVVETYASEIREAEEEVEEVLRQHKN
jgi:hypothetical protein